MYSFEIHFVHVAQKMKEGEWKNYCNFCQIWTPITPSFFMLHKLYVSQKNTFFMQNLISIRSFIVLT